MATSAPEPVAGAVGILGGTFDPVHFGHLRTALELRQALGLAEMRLMPASLPPHREAPGSGAAHRLEMLRLAVAGEPALCVDDRELRRAGPSYSYDTLASLRQELGPARPLVMALGVDAFALLDTWHRWRELAGLASIAVISRPGAALPASGPVAELLAARRCEPAALAGAPAGRIALLELTPLGISATQIRTLIAAGGTPRYLLPDPVWHYILQHQLYGAGRMSAGAA